MRVTPGGRDPRATVGLGLAAVIVASCAIGLVLDFSTPWAFIADSDAPMADRVVHRDDLVTPEEENAYLRSITSWPILAWTGGMAAAGLVAAATLIAPAVPLARGLRTAAAAAILLFGALLLIAKLRHLGMMWGGLWFGDAPAFHPHVASYAQIAGGLLFLAAGAYLLVPALRARMGAGALNPFRGPPQATAALTCIGVLVTLALLAFFPYAGTETGLTSFGEAVTEHRLARAAETPGAALFVAGDALASVRTFLWIAFVISLAAALAQMIAATRPGIRMWTHLGHIQLLAVVPILLSLGHGIVHFVALTRDLEGLPIFNWTPILAPLALLALQYRYYRGAASTSGPATTQDLPPAAPPTTREPPTPPRRGRDDDVEEIVIDAAPQRKPRAGARA